MKREYSFAERVGRIALFYYFLSLLVSVAAVAANHRPAYPAGLDLGLGRHFDNDRESQFVLVLQ